MYISIKYCLKFLKKMLTSYNHQATGGSRGRGGLPFCWGSEWSSEWFSPILDRFRGCCPTRVDGGGSLFRINCQGQQMLLEKIPETKQIWECLSHWATVQVFVDQEYPSDIQFLLFDFVHLHRIDDGFMSKQRTNFDRIAKKNKRGFSRWDFVIRRDLWSSFMPIWNIGTLFISKKSLGSYTKWAICLRGCQNPEIVGK